LTTPFKIKPMVPSYVLLETIILYYTTFVWNIFLENTSFPRYKSVIQLTHSAYYSIYNIKITLIVLSDLGNLVLPKHLRKYSAETLNNLDYALLRDPWFTWFSLNIWWYLNVSCISRKNHCGFYIISIWDLKQ